MRVFEDDFYDDRPTLIEQLIEEKKRKGLLPKTSYTKYEVIAMLTEIQLEIEEKKTDYDKDLKIEHDIYHAYNRCSKIIQQKINELKGGK